MNSQKLSTYIKYSTGLMFIMLAIYIALIGLLDLAMIEESFFSLFLEYSRILLSLTAALFLGTFGVWMEKTARNKYD